jgi:spore germination protein GerM
MRLSSKDASKWGSRLGLTAVVLLTILAVTAVAASCGYGSEAQEGGGISTTESTQTTVTEPSEQTTTTAQAPASTIIPSSTTTATAGDPDETVTLNVYYVQDEKICAAARVVPKTQQVGAAAMEALLEGPTTEEEAAGVFDAIPEGTTFLGLDIEAGIASVDLSKEYASGGGTLSMSMRLAQVVFTLTQFPTVEGVEFKVDGRPVEVFGGEGIILDHPVDRSDYEELSPAILVESPTLGNTVASPLRVTGTANTFEATFRINVVNWDGLIIAEQVVTATSGTGTRGTFDVTVPFEVDRAGLGALIAFENSAKDGAPINVVEIPLQLEK